MKLSLKQWVKFGNGLLYGAPFLSRCLVYRLRDQKCSLLIHHARNVVGSSRVDSDLGLHACSATFQLPGTMFVQIESSSDAVPLLQLVELPRSEIKLSTEQCSQFQFGNLTIEAKPISLPMKDMIILKVDRDQTNRYQIENADFSIVGHGFARDLRGVVAKTDLQLKCWGIVIRCNQTGVNYDMLSPQEWSVTAIEAEENWQQCLEMHLEKNHAAN